MGDVDFRLDFKVAVLAVDGRCLAHDDDRDCDGDLAAHHVVYQKTLRKLGLDADLWDPRNGMALCYRAHRRHHNGTEILALSRLPQRCVEFADARGLLYVLERVYATDDGDADDSPS